MRTYLAIHLPKTREIYSAQIYRNHRAALSELADFGFDSGKVIRLPRKAKLTPAREDSSFLTIKPQ